MKFYVLLLCVFLLPFIKAEGETTTEVSGSANPLAENAPESKPEPDSATAAENNNKPAESITEGKVKDDNGEAQEQKSDSESKVAVGETGGEEQIVYNNTESKHTGGTTPATNTEGEEMEEHNDTESKHPTASTPTPSEEEAKSTDEKPLLKTMSDLTDQNKVKESETLGSSAQKKDKIAELNADDKGKDKEERVSELREDKVDTEPKLETENKDQEQQEVNLVFPTDLVKKDDEFEKMAKEVGKPNNEPDDALASKLAPNWTEHLDHNKPDEQPTIVFENQQKNNDRKNAELEEKIEQETEIADSKETHDQDDHKKKKGKNKNYRMDLQSESKEDQTESTTTVLDKSKENLEETKDRKKADEENSSGEKAEKEKKVEEVKTVNPNIKNEKETKIEQPQDVEIKDTATNKNAAATPKQEGTIMSAENPKDHSNAKEIKPVKKLVDVGKDESTTDSNESGGNSKETLTNQISKEESSKETSDLKAVKTVDTPHAKVPAPTSSEEHAIPQHKESENNAPQTKADKTIENSLGQNKMDNPQSVEVSAEDIEKIRKKASKVKDKKMKAKLKKALAKQKAIQDEKAAGSKGTPVKKAYEMSEEELKEHAMKFEKLQPTSTLQPEPKIPLSPGIPLSPVSNAASTANPLQGNQAEGDGCNVNTSLVFAEVVFRHGDRYKGEDLDETYPNDPYALEDPFWLPYGCDQMRNKGKMRALWLGQYLRKRYSGFLGEEYYHNDVRFVSADLNRCIDSAHVVATGLYPPKGINIWNDNVGRFYQPVPVRTLNYMDDIYLNEEVVCHPYEKELALVMNEKMKNFNTKYKYVYEYLEMYAGMPVRNLEDVAQIYTTLRIENENGRALPEWVNLVFPQMLKTLNSYYNQIRFSSHFFKRIQAGPLLSVMLDELKLKSINHLKPNYKIKFWSGFDTTILKLLYTMKETQPSLDKAEDLLETDYSGVLMIELHLIKKIYYVKVFYINMDPLFFKSHAPREVKICGGKTLCPLDDFLERMEKYRFSQKEWYQACNKTYCKTEPMEKVAFN